MDRSRLVNVLLVLLILIAGLVLAQMLWGLFSGFSDLILLFSLGWLLSFILNPMVTQLSQRPIPRSVIILLRPLLGSRRTEEALSFRVSRGMVVVLVYLGLVLALAISLALLVPVGITQSSQIASHLPDYMTQAPEIGLLAQEQLARLGLQVNLEDAVRGALGGLQNVITPVVQNALGIFTTIVSVIADIFFVLILGFYFTLDGPRLGGRAIRVVPKPFTEQVRFFGQSVDRTFGAFIRGQLIQSLLIALGSALMMGVVGLDFVLIASVFVGLVMLIPLVGPYLALIPPLLVVVFQKPDLTLWLFLALFAYQFAVVNILMPRVVGEAVGLHPLLVFGAILVSIKVAGFWGAFFGIPVAGVLWAMAEFFFEQWSKQPIQPTERGPG